jgi:hypothetical protein
LQTLYTALSKLSKTGICEAMYEVHAKVRYKVD